MSDKYQLKCYIHLYTLLVFVRLIVKSMRVLKVGLRQICLTIAASSLFIAPNAASFNSFEGSERVDVDFNKVGRNFVGLVITNYVYVGAGGATFQTTAHCTGVLVASDKILTCAHCLEMPSELKQFRNIRRGSTYFLESMGLTDHVHEDYDERLEGSEHLHRVQGVDLAPELAKDLDNNFLQEAKTGKGFLKDSDLLGKSIYRIDLKNLTARSWFGSSARAASDMAIVSLAGAVPNFQSRMIFDPLNITKNQPQNAHAIAYSPDRNLGLIPSFEESCRIDRWDSGLDGWAHNCSLRRGGSGAPLYSDESDGYRHLHCISCKERQVVAADAKLEPETTLPYIFGFNNNLGTDLGMIPRDLLSRFGIKVTPAGNSP